MAPTWVLQYSMAQAAATQLRGDCEIHTESIVVDTPQPGIGDELACCHRAPLPRWLAEWPALELVRALGVAAANKAAALPACSCTSGCSATSIEGAV